MTDSREQDALRFGILSLGGEDMDNLEFTEKSLVFKSTVEWWTSTSLNKESSWIRKIEACSNQSKRETYNKYFGFYVRCIAD